MGPVSVIVLHSVSSQSACHNVTIIWTGCNLNRKLSFTCQQETDSFKRYKTLIRLVQMEPNQHQSLHYILFAKDIHFVRYKNGSFGSINALSRPNNWGWQSINLQSDFGKGSFMDVTMQKKILLLMVPKFPFASLFIMRW